MLLDFVPLLDRQRRLQAMPIGMARFQSYLRTVTNADGDGVPIAPLVLVNPMAKEHVTALLDAFIAHDADGAAAQAVRETSAQVADVPGIHKISLVIIDDARGGWTNRAATEFHLRFDWGAPGEDGWLCGVLWSSEPASVETARQAVLMAIHRAAYRAEHGPAQTLVERMAQEGHVMCMAGCTGPTLDPDDLAYSREVIEPFGAETDFRTTVECLFGDAAARSLGFTPRGLSAGAGLALALHDAQVGSREAAGVKVN